MSITEISTKHMTHTNTIKNPQNHSIIKRNGKGRFIKGVRYSIETEFKKGMHWRKEKPYWNKEWLLKEYILNKKSASEIAKEQNCKKNNIYYFLQKHSIKSRNISECRKIKHWGSPGKANGMYGQVGRLNPNWDGGASPERQSKYARSAWKVLSKSILKRDGYKCRKCSMLRTEKNRLIVHHIKKWSRYPELRFEPKNLITVCEKCHKKIHFRRK